MASGGIGDADGVAVSSAGMEEVKINAEQVRVQQIAKTDVYQLVYHFDIPDLCTEQARYQCV